MPDRDVLDRRLAPGWVRPYRLLCGEAPRENVAHAALGALAQTLRANGGLPYAEDLSETLSLLHRGRIDFEEAARRLRAIERASNGHRHTRIASRTVMRLALRLQDMPSCAPLQELTAAFCKDLLNHHLLDKSLPALIGSRFLNYKDAFCWQREFEVLIEDGLARLGKLLAKDLSGERIRAPQTVKLIKDSTSELLNQPLSQLLRS